jgi:hypothetical protein
MNLDLKITLFFLSIILSFYIAFFNFYDVGRYCSIRNAKTIEPYVEKYSNLQPFTENSVTVSFTLLNEKDITSIQPMIISLLDQTYKAHLILSIVDKKFYVIPSNYDGNRFLTIDAKENNDYKKFTNLVPIISGNHKEADEKVLVINNNHKIYGKDFIQQMVQESVKKPKTVIISNSMDVCSSEAYLVEPGFFKRITKDSFSDDCNWFNNILLPDIKTSNFRYIENYSY